MKILLFPIGILFTLFLVSRSLADLKVPNQNYSVAPNGNRSITVSTVYDGNSPLTYTIAAMPGHGTLSGTGPTFIYTPQSNYWGTDAFTVKVSDGTLSDSGLVKLQVAAVVDDDDGSGVAVAGNWLRSSPPSGQYWGTSFLDNNKVNSGANTFVSFSGALSTPGIYDVFIWYPIYGSLGATAVPIEVRHGTLTGSTTADTVSINQSSGGGNWLHLGRYIFNASPNQAVVTVKTEGSNLSKNVTADAVSFVYVKPIPSTIPETPTGLSGRIHWRNAILSWSSGSTIADGFKIEQSADGRVFSEVGTTNEHAKSFITPALQLNATYYFRVTAFNVRGASPPSETISLMTPPPTNSIIPDERKIDWQSSAGIPGGIPNYPVWKSARELGALGDGHVDDGPALQDAINSCPADHAVYLPAGTYRITAPLQMRSHVVLRGSGPGNTIIAIDFPATKLGGIQFMGTSSWYPDKPSNVLNGAKKGDTNLTLDSAPGLKAGTFVLLDQLNDPNLVTIDSTEETPCLGCSRLQGTRAFQQLIEVTSVTPGAGGLLVNFSPPLFWDYRPEFLPQATYRVNNAGSNYLTYSGIEELTIDNLSGTANYMINFNYTGYSWVKGVETAHAAKSHVNLNPCFRCEIRNNYFHDTWGNASGGNYGILLYSPSTSSLIENNIVNNTISAFIIGGAAGNVFGYNYSHFVNYTPANWLQADLSMHDAHSFMNLYESNVGHAFIADCIHGSGSHNTAFRNILKARQPGTTNQNRAVVLDVWNRYFNIIGNVLGEPGFPGRYQCLAPEACPSTTNTIWQIGYGLPSARIDPAVYATTIRHGNFDYVSESIAEWNDGISQHSLPKSLYLSSKPTWFGDIPWPAIGPDLTPKVNKIPAERCFETQALGSGGRFNPSQCYSLRPQAPASAPQNLQVDAAD